MLSNYKNPYKYATFNYIYNKEKEKSVAYNNYIILLMLLVILMIKPLVNLNKTSKDTKYKEIESDINLTNYSNEKKDGNIEKFSHGIYDLFKLEEKELYINNVSITKEKINMTVTFINNNAIDDFIGYWSKHESMKLKSMEYIKNEKDKYTFNAILSY
ncbi:hypothetical protein [Clostridium amazonitimonense]|uniref:hypothetical protein n=1 Tax=Clostridium amazonitimonense TaxID=1499689 RepID=UPI000509FC4C|nr:hypothetical protein [Clostridium amazonitimonense]